MWRVTLSEDLTGESEPDAGQGLKVQEYRVWADTGAAFLASRGELKRLESANRGNERSPAGAHKMDEKLGGKRDILGSGLSFGGSSG